MVIKLDKKDVCVEYCDPFDSSFDYWMRVEHLGRYLWANDILKNKNTKNVLDIACCNGYGTKILSEVVKKITGIDSNKKYIKIANKKNNNSNIRYLTMNIDNDEVNGKYDAIVCFETLEHVKYPDLMLQNLYNALEEDGVLLLSVPNEKYEIIENGKT